MLKTQKKIRMILNLITFWFSQQNTYETDFWFWKWWNCLFRCKNGVMRHFFNFFIFFANQEKWKTPQVFRRILWRNMNLGVLATMMVMIIR